MVMTTHEVLNQPEPLVSCKLSETSQGLPDALEFNAQGRSKAKLYGLGQSGVWLGPGTVCSGRCFCHSRLDGHGSHTLGMLAFGRDFDRILARTMPASCL